MAGIQTRVWRGSLRPDLRETASALPRLEALLMLVDDVNPSLAADDLALLVSGLERPKRILDLHSITFPAFKSGTTLRQNGGRDWDRTSDPYDVNVVLYR